MKIEYEVMQREQVDDTVRKIFANLLHKQQKVKGDLAAKADRCRLLCIARVDGVAVAIGGIKNKIGSDFSDAKAGLPELERNFEWELGYFYTDDSQRGRGIASTIARLLLDAYGKGPLMASTEIASNSAMVRILENHRFRLFGKPWKSGLHGNCLGLFLRFD